MRVRLFKDNLRTKIKRTDSDIYICHYPGGWVVEDAVSRSSFRCVLRTQEYEEGLNFHCRRGFWRVHTFIMAQVARSSYRGYFWPDSQTEGVRCVAVM